VRKELAYNRKTHQDPALDRRFRQGQLAAGNPISRNAFY
jgi:hypothetical protein